MTNNNSTIRVESRKNLLHCVLASLSLYKTIFYPELLIPSPFASPKSRALRNLSINLKEDRLRA